MSRAEERALEFYPELLSGSIFGPLPVDLNKAYREKYQEGYAQAEKDLGWISVKDRLPEVGHFVLTCVDDSGIPQSVGMALLLKDGTWWDGDMKVYVDYWMEVPKLKK